ncbi:MAG TPA: hypothetical protein VM925_37645 [Labilithrix sp.]|nr:hypothetical protein [Labilithrix sp.]
MRPSFFVLPCALVLASIAACDDATTNTTDAGTPPDGGPGDASPSEHEEHEEHDSGVVDSGPPPIRCTDAELAANDKTDGGALTITFLKGANPRQYENHCATVKAGASVTFSGSFRQHPLAPAGGDSPNPIPYTPTDQPNDELVVTMTSAGTFGYECEFHPTSMFGAIRVVP